MARIPAGDEQAAAPSVFDLKPPRERRELGLTDRQITDIAWEDHVAENFGAQAKLEDRGGYDSE
jgi:hypothetical protein